MYVVFGRLLDSLGFFGTRWVGSDFFVEHGEHVFNGVDTSGLENFFPLGELLVGFGFLEFFHVLVDVTTKDSVSVNTSGVDGFLFVDFLVAWEFLVGGDDGRLFDQIKNQSSSENNNDSVRKISTCSSSSTTSLTGNIF